MNYGNANLTATLGLLVVAYDGYSDIHSDNTNDYNDHRGHMCNGNDILIDIIFLFTTTFYISEVRMIAGRRQAII